MIGDAEFAFDEFGDAWKGPELGREAVGDRAFEEHLHESSALVLVEVRGATDFFRVECPGSFLLFGADPAVYDLSRYAELFGDFGRSRSVFVEFDGAFAHGLLFSGREGSMWTGSIHAQWHDRRPEQSKELF